MLRFFQSFLNRTGSIPRLNPRMCAARLHKSGTYSSELMLWCSTASLTCLGSVTGAHSRSTETRACYVTVIQQCAAIKQVNPSRPTRSGSRRGVRMCSETIHNKGSARPSEGKDQDRISIKAGSKTVTGCKELLMEKNVWLKSIIKALSGGQQQSLLK